MSDSELYKILNELTAIKKSIDHNSSRWLTLSEAIAYSRRGKNWLLEKLANGDIYGYKEVSDGKWIVDKSSIDDFHLANKIRIQLKVEELKKKR